MMQWENVEMQCLVGSLVNIKQVSEALKESLHTHIQRGRHSPSYIHEIEATLAFSTSKPHQTLDE